MKVGLDHWAWVGATSADLLRPLCDRQVLRDALSVAEVVNRTPAT